MRREYGISAYDAENTIPDWERRMLVRWALEANEQIDPDTERPVLLEDGPLSRGWDEGGAQEAAIVDDLLGAFGGGS
jgi:hypothetical protein